MVIYGDNGTGKSSITDSVEWFFCDHVKHLATEEIGKGGHHGLRNVSLDDQKDGAVSLKFSDGDFDGEKVIKLTNNKLTSTHTNYSAEFNSYIEASKGEALILRYRDLSSFVLSTKGDRLKAFSNIIGYSKLTDIRDSLKTASYQLSKDFQSHRFDDSVNNQQRKIIEQFGQNVTSEKQFLEVVRSLVKPFSLGMDIATLSDIDEVMKRLGNLGENTEVTLEEDFLKKLQLSLSDLPRRIDNLELKYRAYELKFKAIVDDIGKLADLIVWELLAAGQKLLSEESYSGG